MPLLSHNKTSLRYLKASLSAVLLLACQLACADDDYNLALSRVKSLSCNSENVEQYLDHKLKPSHRDLGWQVFKNDHGYDVERTFLVSKSMELRYRWRMSWTGKLDPVTDRAKALCS